MPRKNPHIYEINLVGWLAAISQREGRPVGIRDIPAREWDRIKEMGMDIVWLMGIWSRSPYSRKEAQNAPALVKECESIIPDFAIKDIGGSPYSIYRYVPDPSFGTLTDLADLKETLQKRGLFLVLDFVPNHTACDHPWIKTHPEYYISHVKKGDQACEKGYFSADTDRYPACIAHGKDPYFPPWTDTAQLDYTVNDTQSAMIRTMSRVSTYCHGMRCDMAMLVLQEIFHQTWGNLAKGETDKEFWLMAIDRIMSTGRECTLIAEAYWGRETELLSYGFDYAYDKTLYDLMVQGDIQGIREHVVRPFQANMLHFLENHDEPRALSCFGPDRIKCAMVIHATLPGMRLWHSGQFEGDTLHVPVQLNQQGWLKLIRAGSVHMDIYIENMHKNTVDNGVYEEAFSEGHANDDIRQFSEQLLREVNHPVFHEGKWEMCHTEGWPDNQSHRNILAWCWRYRDERRLVVINFSSSPAQGHIRLPDMWLPEGDMFVLDDPINDETYYRSARDITDSGLYVGLDAGHFHFFRIGR